MKNNFLLKKSFSLALPYNALTRVIITCLIILFAANANANEKADVLLLKDAISLRQKGEFQQAIATLEPLQRKYLNHKRINIELAINYIKLKNYQQAQARLVHLKKLKLTLAEQKKIAVLEKWLTKNQQSFSSTNASNKQHTFMAELSSYIGIDNVNSQFPFYEYIDDINDQDSYQIDDGDTFISRSDKIEQQSNTYNALQVKLFHRYLAKDKLTLFPNNLQFAWQNNITLYRQEFNQKNSYQQVKWDSYLNLFTNKHWQLELRLRSRNHYTSNQRILTELGQQWKLTIPFKQTQLKLAWEYRNNSFTRDVDLNNAKISTPWLEYMVPITKQFKLYFGSRYQKKNAKDPFNSYKNLNFYMRAHYNYHNKLKAYLSLNHNKLNYQIDDLEIVNWGSETKRSVTIGIEYNINNRFSIGFNGHLLKNTLDLNNGSEQWFRTEGYLSYQFY